MLDYLDDLESDFSAIHRVDDIYSLDGPRFFKFAYRMAAYKGVLQARIRAEQEDADPSEDFVSSSSIRPDLSGWYDRTVVAE